MLGLIISMSGCQNKKELETQREQLENLSVENESLKSELESMTIELESIVKDRDQAQQKAERFEDAINEMKKEIEIQEGDVTVTVVSKGQKPKDYNRGLYNNYVETSLNVKNNTTKDIQGVQGNLKVMDLFGVEILTMGCDFTGKTITVDTSQDYNMVYEVNPYMSEQMKYYSTDFQDLKFEYNVKSIVFMDGTTKN